MTTATWIDTSNPYPDYTTKYNVNTHLGARLASFGSYDEAAAWAEANGYCIVPGSMGWNRGGNPPCPEAYIPTVSPKDPSNGKREIDPKVIIIAIIAFLILSRA